MNFGCPVPKVTRRGGGAALPYKRRLFGQIVAAAVRATEGTDIPVTVKFRIGIDDAHHTHLDAGRIAEQEGAAAVALHARTAAQRYSGAADWEQIAQLKQHVTSIPVLGNGDIFDASDALTMMATHRVRRSGDRPRLPGPAMAVRRVVGGIHRGGRPHPADAGRGRRHRPPPRRPAGRRISARTRACVTSASTSPGTCTVSRPAPICGARWRWSRRCGELDELLDGLDPEVPFPPAATGPRGRQGSAGSVALPDGWLADPDDCTVPAGADAMHSGG